MKYCHRPLAHPSLPHIIECKKDTHLLDGPFVVKPEVKTWLNDTIGPQDWKQGVSYLTVFMFRTEEQAMMFKIAWAG